MRKESSTATCHWETSITLNTSLMLKSAPLPRPSQSYQTLAQATCGSSLLNALNLLALLSKSMILQRVQPMKKTVKTSRFNTVQATLRDLCPKKPLNSEELQLLASDLEKLHPVRACKVFLCQESLGLLLTPFQPTTCLPSLNHLPSKISHSPLYWGQTPKIVYWLFLALTLVLSLTSLNSPSMTLSKKLGG